MSEDRRQKAIAMGMVQRKYGRSLGECFVAAARTNWYRCCISDSTSKLTYGQTLVKALALAEQIKKLSANQEKVGILLPPSVAATLANVAVTLAGKVAVNLNYTVCGQVVKSAIQQCEIKTVISSRKFLEKIRSSDALPGLIFIEDIVEKIGFVSKLKAYLKSRLLPRRFLTKALSCGDGLATVIFSSGSSGEPKGVMLSHKNILSNIEAVTTVFELKGDDNFCGILPFFHLFGFTCALWLPLLCGVSASFAANPLDGKNVGQVCRENKSTALFTAPTFLLNYIKRAQRQDFASLRVVVTGAEKLKKTIADSFEEKFSVRPLEGYGATELSPVVSLNMPEELSTGLCPVGVKEGTVGLPIPGVEVKVICPWSRKQLPAGQDGLLLVKGHGVMLGYLNKEKETQEVVQDGWYNTGDIGSLDEDGFVTITDRLSRFSKIGGEMVPHINVEQTYLNGLCTDEQLVAVTSVPDEKKGEELVILHLDKTDADELHKIISKSTLPNMWKPKRENYIRIESIPALGSGKLDAVKLRHIALEKYKDNKPTT